MPTFKILSGSTKAKTGFFISPFGKSQISINETIFSSRKIDLDGVTLSTEGLHAPDGNSVRFYLRDSSDEWLCECSARAYSDLELIVLRQKSVSHSNTSETTFFDALTSGGMAVMAKKMFIAAAMVVLGAVLIKSCSSGVKQSASAPKEASLLYKATHGDNSGSKNTNAQLNPAEAEKSLKKKISNNVFLAYDQKQYPKTFSKFGSRMPEVERARQAAALVAASSRNCSFVDMSEVSDSSTKANIQIFTDCQGPTTGTSERFRFQESELKDKKGRFFTEATIQGAQEPLTVSQQAMPKDRAIAICKEAVTMSAKFPSSVDFSTFGATAKTSQGNGETSVELEFEAKNALGASLPYLANCGFPINGKPTLSVNPR